MSISTYIVYRNNLQKVSQLAQLEEYHGRYFFKHTMTYRIVGAKWRGQRMDEVGKCLAIPASCLALLDARHLFFLAPTMKAPCDPDKVPDLLDGPAVFFCSRFCNILLTKSLTNPTSFLTCFS